MVIKYKMSRYSNECGFVIFSAETGFKTGIGVEV